MITAVTVLISFILLIIAAVFFKVLFLPLKLALKIPFTLIRIPWIRNLILLGTAVLLLTGSFFIWEWQRPSWYRFRFIPEEDMKLMKLRAESARIHAEETLNEWHRIFKKKVQTAKSEADDQVTKALSAAQRQSKGIKPPRL